MSYKAVVCKIHTRPHPNADRLQLGLCKGNQVIVGLDTEDGELGVYFDTDGQLSKEFCEANMLYRHQGGYFDDNRRVRAQNFRGERSDGFWVPLSYFAFTGVDALKEGDEFDELGGVPICNKYITPATRRAMAQGKKARRRETAHFPRHPDTQQFRRFAEDIPAGALITITEKVHGTSQRYGHVWDREKIDLPWWKRLVNRFRYVFSPYKEDWRYLLGSRNVILDFVDFEDFHGTSFRQEAVRKLDDHLHKGEILFFEVVGWQDSQTPIMPPGKVKALQDDEYVRNYGQAMFWSYGCRPGEHTIFIYRIAITTVDGHVIDLPWWHVKERCKKLGIQHVPEVCDPFIYDGDVDNLRALVDELMSGPSAIDSRHIREGVCIRADVKDEVRIFKAKSYEFGVLEGYLKSKDSYVDLEEVA